MNPEALISKFQAHDHFFAIFYFLVVGAIFAPGEELMSYAVVPSFVGLAFSLDFGAPFMVDQGFGKAFLIIQVRGWDCCCS